MNRNYLIDNVSLNYEAINVKTYLDFKFGLKQDSIEILIDNKSIGVIPFKNYCIMTGEGKTWTPLSTLLHNDFVAQSRLKTELSTTLRLLENKKDIEVSYQNRTVGFIRATTIPNKKGMFVRVYNIDNEPKCINVDELF